MERHVGLSLLSVGTEVSDCVCVSSQFLGNHLMSKKLYTSNSEFIYNS